jgi:tetratricopeptide (TPR) repeat protein
MSVFGKGALAAGSFAVVAVLGAATPQVGLSQEPEPRISTCTIDESSPREVARAYLALGQAGGAEAGGENRMRYLRDAVRLANENMDRGQNVLGRNYIMARAFMMMLEEPGVSAHTTRGQVGFTLTPQQPIDLLAASDSLFTLVAQERPDCAEDVADWRLRQPWLDIINDAVAQLQAGQLDSAEALANRSMVIERENPYGFQILASVAHQRRDVPKATELWRKTIEAASNDTAMADVKREAQYYLGSLLATAANDAEDAERVRIAREAAAAYQAYLADAPTEPNAAAVRTNLSIVMGMAGDTAGIPALYADLLANPDRYGFDHHFQAGVIAVRAERSADAARLFETAHKLAPYNRDAAFNLAATYSVLGDAEKMIPLLSNLLGSDPNNPTNFELAVYAYSIMQQKETDAARKRVLTDSLVKYGQAAENLVAAVEVSSFGRGQAETTLQGTIQNRSSAARSFNLEFEFVDAQGNVIASQNATIGPVEPNASAPFSVTVAQGNVVGYRYKPIQ